MVVTVFVTNRILCKNIVNEAIADLEYNLVGFLLATIEQEIPIYRLQEFGFIHDIWVEPEYRQQGIARQMVMLAIERCQQIGVKQIRLDTAAINEAARRLFQSCGFRISTIEMLMEVKSQESKVQ